MDAPGRSRDLRGALADGQGETTGGLSFTRSFPGRLIQRGSSWNRAPDMASVHSKITNAPTNQGVGSSNLSGHANLSKYFQLIG
jgi:hypothetical protein